MGEEKKRWRYIDLPEGGCCACGGTRIKIPRETPRGLYKRCACPSPDQCQHAFWMRYTHEGLTYRRACSDFAQREIRTKHDAQTVLEDFRSAIRSGTYKADPPPTTWDAFCDLYEEKHRDAKGLRSWSDLCKVETLRTKFKDHRLQDMTRPEPFEAFLDTLKKRKPSTRNRYRALMRSMLRFAKKRDLIKGHFFEKDLCLLEREMNERSRRLQPDEEAKLLEFADQDMKDAIILSLDTGLRRGALFALELRDIDFKRKYLIVRAETQKHSEGQIIPLTARAFECVKRRATADEPLFGVFQDRNSFTRAWYRTLEKAGLKDKDLHWHDLRAEFASRLGDRGVRVEVASKMLGHKNLKTTMRYCRPHLKDFQDAIRKMDNGDVP